jgi:hypothetical protein
VVEPHCLYILIGNYHLIVHLIIIFILAKRYGRDGVVPDVSNKLIKHLVLPIEGMSEFDLLCVSETEKRTQENFEICGVIAYR